MNWRIGLVTAMIVGCSHEHRRLTHSDLIQMKRAGISDDGILREVRKEDVILDVYPEDEPELREAGFEANIAQALIGIAEERRSRKPGSTPSNRVMETDGHKH